MHFISFKKQNGFMFDNKVLYCIFQGFLAFPSPPPPEDKQLFFYGSKISGKFTSLLRSL